MIVVVGGVLFAAGRRSPAIVAAGLAAETAVAAAAGGASVQLVAKVGDDPAGDSVLIALHEAGVGHAAVLRDSSHPTPTVAVTPDLAPTTDADSDADSDPASEPESGPLPNGLLLEAADLELALRYLTDFRVLVLADDLDRAVRAVALEGAAFAGAHVIDLHDGFDGDERIDAGHFTAFDATGTDPEAFGRMAGRYAAGLDAGLAPAVAFADATRTAHWESSGDR